MSLIENELKKVEIADLSNFDKTNNTYFIPRKNAIKVAVENCYLVHLKPTFFNNATIRVNWNKNSVPSSDHLIVDVSKVMNNMIRVVGTEYDIINKCPKTTFWSGWLPLGDIEILEKL